MKRLKAFWKGHGTKILGYAAMVPSSVGSALAYISANPSSPTLIPHKYFVPLCFVNLIIGAFTVNRGYTNSRNGSNPPT